MQAARLRHLLLITLAVIAIYANSLRSEFILDDWSNIEDNPSVRSVRYFLDPALIDSVQDNENLKYHFRSRITGYFTLFLNYQIGGSNPIGYHIVNVLVHIMNSLLLYGFVLMIRRKMDDAQENTERSGTIALIAALLFACHPLESIAVAYITQRFASLVTLFFLISVMAYWAALMGNRSRGRSRMLYAASLFAGLLAAMTKENSVTLPVVLTMVELVFFRDSRGMRLARLAPFYVMALIPPALMLISPGTSLGAEGMEEIMRIGKKASPHTHMEYLISAPGAVLGYLRLIALPFNQTTAYKIMAQKSILSAFVPILAVLGMIAMTAYGLVRGRNRTATVAAFGAAWFFITISIEAGVIPLVDIMNEQRVYLPSVGLFIAIAAGMGHVRVPKKTGLIISGAVIGVLCILTVARNRTMHDGVSVAEDAFNKTTPSSLTYFGLGVAYEDKQYYDKAEWAYRHSIELAPNYAKAYLNLGNVYFSQRQLEKAGLALMIAKELRPYDWKAPYNLGNVLAAQSRWQEAVANYQISVQLRPGFIPGLRNLAWAYERMGRREDAVRALRQVIAIKPDDITTKQSLKRLSSQ